jgi:hypothetical protein
MTNEERGDAVKPHVEAFATDMGLQHDEPQTIAGDMIAAILHWAASEGGLEAAIQGMRGGISHFTIEHAAGPASEDTDGDAKILIEVEGFAYDLNAEKPREEKFRIVSREYLKTEVIEGFTASRAAFTVVNGRAA